MTAMKCSIIGLTLFLLAGSTWAGTFSDNFDDGNMDEWTLFRPFGQGSAWKIENGEIILQAIDGPIGFDIGETTWKNYTVRAKTKIVKHQPAKMEQAQLVVRQDVLG